MLLKLLNIAKMLPSSRTKSHLPRGCIDQKSRGCIDPKSTKADACLVTMATTNATSGSLTFTELDKSMKKQMLQLKYQTPQLNHYTSTKLRVISKSSDRCKLSILSQNEIQQYNVPGTNFGDYCNSG